MIDETGHLKSLSPQDRAELSAGEIVAHRIRGRCRSGHTWPAIRKIREIGFLVLKGERISIFQIEKYPERNQCPTCGGWVFGWEDDIS